MGKNNKKYTYEEVKKIVEDLGYELISEKYVNNRNKLILKDKEGYKYYNCLDKILQYNNPKRFHTCNPYTIENIKNWCVINSKQFILLSDIYNGNNTKMEWKCLKPECNEIFKMCWNDILANKGCAVCAGQQIGKSNCLSTLNPELAKEWNYEKNKKLTPYDVGIGYEKTDIWWKCKNNSEHEWKTTISSRHNLNNGCPYCSGRYPTKENNLLVANPKLCEEWDYEKNKKSPEEYTPNSGKKVFWICSECGYEWQAIIGDRNKRSRGCPQCNESKGEKRIAQYLKENIINYIPQKEFEGLVGLGNGNLSYDFYFLEYNLLIEFQGEQHEHYIKGFHKNKKEFEKQIEHDRKKREYAKQNNIKLLEIWYWDFDNIEEILSKELNLNNQACA